MKQICCISILLFCAAVAGANAQTACPDGMVCVDQATANKLFKMGNDLIAAKDLIVKMTADAAASSAVINSAKQVIEDYKAKDEINGQIILKYKDVVALYEKVIAMQNAVIDKLTAQINKPRSAWSKFAGIVEKVIVLLAGISLGRVL